MGKYFDKELFLSSMGLCGDETKYGNRDAEHQSRSYSTWMGYEIMDSVEDSEVDAVPVVRCKDCMHSKKNGYLCIRKTKNAGYNAADKVFPGFFCAAGKVMDGNETD